MQSIGDGTNFGRRPVKNSAMSIYTVGRSYFLEFYHCWYLVRSELSTDQLSMAFAPTTVNRTVVPVRRANKDLRTRLPSSTPVGTVLRDRRSRGAGQSPRVSLIENNEVTVEDRMKFRPLHDRVVVKGIEAEEKTAGGIIIPDTAKEKPQQGEVVSVGPGGRDESGKLIPIDVKPGDRVLFGKWSGTEVKLDGVEYLIMKESDIMGVIDEPVAKKKAA